MQLSRHLRGIVNHVEPATLPLFAEYTDYGGIPDNGRLHLALHDKHYDLTVVNGNNASLAERRNWFWRIPAIQWDSWSSRGKAPASDTTALVALAVWGINKLTFEDAETEAFTRYNWTRFALSWQVAEAQARYKTVKSVPGDAPAGNKLNPLSPYQRVAAYCALKSDGYMLHMEQGTGKTAVAVAVIDEIAAKRKKAGKITLPIIVCPMAVIGNWQQEILKFSRLRAASVAIRGDLMTRKSRFIDAAVAAATGKYDWCAAIMSFEGFADSIAWLAAGDYPLFVLDEAHNFKTPTTKRFRSWLAVQDIFAKTLQLTGTPITNNVFDLYSQLEIVGPGCSGFRDHKTFKHFYGTWDTTPTGHEVFAGLKNTPMLQERLARSSFRTTKAEALPELPAKLYDIRDVQMTKEQSKVYEAISIKLCSEIENELATSDKPPTVTVNNILVRLLRLAQVTSGFVSTDATITDNPDGSETITPGEVNRFDPNPKLDALIEIVKDLPSTSKVIVWACFGQNIRSISARLTLEKIGHCVYHGGMNDEQRAEAVAAFNTTRDCQVFVGNQAAGGTGLNLLGQCDAETACDHVIYFSQGWNMAHRSQSEDRAHRRGTSRPVQVTDLVVPESIDDEIRERVLKKRKTASMVQDVQDILQNILRKK